MGGKLGETIADNLTIEKGIHTLRMRILTGGFNFNWMEFDYPDSDGDGVLDDNDDCQKHTRRRYCGCHRLRNFLFTYRKLCTSSV